MQQFFSETDLVPSWQRTASAGLVQMLSLSTRLGQARARDQRSYSHHLEVLATSAKTMWDLHNGCAVLIFPLYPQALAHRHAFIHSPPQLCLQNSYLQRTWIALADSINTSYVQSSSLDLL